MQIRSDVVFYILALAGLLAPFLLLTAFKYSSGVSLIAGLLVVCIIYSYAAFWGFSMRRGLAAPLYRRQALWVGAVGAYFAIEWLVQALFNPFHPYSGTLQTYFLLDTVRDFGYTVIFAWISATMPLVRQSDPLLRDELRWDRLRLILWPLVVVGVVTTAGLEAITLVTGSQYLLLHDLSTSIPYPAILVGALALGLGIKKSTDMTLRRQLKWFGLSATFIVVVFLLAQFAHTLGFVPASETLLVEAVQYAMVLLAGVFLLRSAKNLVPLFQVPLETVVPNS